jgi:hypothetical protein
LIALGYFGAAKRKSSTGGRPKRTFLKIVVYVIQARDR